MATAEIDPALTLTSLQVQPESKACYPLNQTQVPNFTEMSDLPSTIFIFAGEGAHSASPDLTVLKTSPSWVTCGAIASTEFRVQSSECILAITDSSTESRRQHSLHGAVADAALQELLGRGLKDFLSAESGNHKAPVSPLVTTLINILHADLWRHWGYAPTFVLGHSIGEVAAAYVAGLFSIKEALELAHQLGGVAATLPGAMVHTVVPTASLNNFPHKGLHLAAVNYPLPDSTSVSVSLCGSERHAAEWLAFDEGATKLNPAHPWHHPLYRTTAAFGAFSAGFR